MSELILNQNGRLLTTSRIVADEFKKRHDHVLEAIVKLGLPKSGESSESDFFNDNFLLSEYTNLQNKKQPEYLITEKGFMLLVMGFTGKKAQKAKISFIDAFTEMKEQLQANKIDPNSITRLDIAKMLVESEQERILLQAENERLTPLAEAVQILSETDNQISVGSFASLIGIGQNTLFKILRDSKKLIPRGQRKNTPYQKYLDAGLFKVVEKPFEYDGKIKVAFKTLITGKGQLWLYRGLKKNGHVLQPIMELEAVV